MNNGQKLFAFKLAEHNQKKVSSKGTKWKARNGIAIAGCTTCQEVPFCLKWSDNGLFC